MDMVREWETSLTPNLMAVYILALWPRLQCRRESDYSTQ